MYYKKMRGPHLDKYLGSVDNNLIMLSIPMYLNGAAGAPSFI